MGQVLGIVCRVIATHLIKKAGLTHKTAHRRGHADPVFWQCVDTIAGRDFEQRKAGPKGEGQDARSNLNIHFHMLFLDGVYVEHPDGSVWFRWVKAPSGAEQTLLACDPEEAFAETVGKGAGFSFGTSLYVTSEQQPSAAEKRSGAGRYPMKPAGPAVARSGSLPASRIRW